MARKAIKKPQGVEPLENKPTDDKPTIRIKADESIWLECSVKVFTETEEIVNIEHKINIPYALKPTNINNTEKQFSTLFQLLVTTPINAQLSQFLTTIPERFIENNSVSPVTPSVTPITYKEPQLLQTDGDFVDRSPEEFKQPIIQDDNEE